MKNHEHCLIDFTNFLIWSSFIFLELGYRFEDLLEIKYRVRDILAVVVVK